MASKQPLVLIIRGGWGDNPGGPNAAKAAGEKILPPSSSAALAWLCACWLTASPGTARTQDNAPDLILSGGKILTVDADFSTVQALAVRGDRILATGTVSEIEALAGDDTEIVRLKGATVMPGLIDSHVHSTGAAVYEFDHEIPEMESIADVLAYIESRAAVLEEGEWIAFEEEEKGSLEPGKLADFIVLDRDILECPLEDVRHIEVRRTYLGGRLVHEAAE